MAVMFRHTGSVEFFDYWDSLPKVGLIPDRSSFDPLRIARLMPQVMMVEYDCNNDVWFRLVGTGIADRLGFDPSRKSYLSYLDENLIDVFWIVSQDGSRHALRRIFSRQGPVANGICLRPGIAGSADVERERGNADHSRSYGRDRSYGRRGE